MAAPVTAAGTRMKAAEASIRPWAPPRLLPEMVAAGNRVAACRPQFQIAGPEGDESLRLLPQAPFAADRWIVLRGEVGVFHLGLTLAGLEHLTAPISAGLPLEDLAPELVTAVVAAALEPWLALWARHFPPLRVEAMHATDPGSDRGRFLIQRRVGDAWRDWVALAADASACRWLAQTLADFPVPSHGRVEELPVLLVLVLGRMPLARSELTGIQVGDVLLPPLGEPLKVRLENGVGRTRLGSGRIEQQTCIIEEWEVTHTNEEGMAVEPSEVALDSLESLEVEVSFELGRLPLAIRRLKEMAPGVVLPLGTDSAVVTIRVNQQVAGQGEIVRIGDRLGVRVTAWLEDRKA